MVTLDSLIHLVTPYLKRTGGPRYRVFEFAKFLNKFLFSYQEKNLASESTNLCLSTDAFIGSNGNPVWLERIRFDKKTIYSITDESGCTGKFPETTEILVSDSMLNIRYEKIENIKVGMYKVIPVFEKCFCFRNTVVSKSLKKFNYSSEEEKQKLICEAITVFSTILYDKQGILEATERISKDKKQVLYLFKITEINKLNTSACFHLDFNPNHAIIDMKSEKGISNSINCVRADKYRETIKRNERLCLTKDKEEAILEEDHN